MSDSPTKTNTPVPDLFKLSEIPKIDDSKLSEHNRKELAAKKDKGLKAAELKYQEAMQALDDTKAEAESKNGLAIKKYESAKGVLNLQSSNGLLEVAQGRDQCLGDSPIPEHKKAICIAQFNLEVLSKKVDFQKALQKLDQTKSAAEADWTKAQSEYSSAKSVADSELEKAKQTAEVEYYKALSQELEKVL